MGDPYTSCPVDRTSREFRLLRLQPNNDKCIIRCDMQTYSPTDCPPYVALSYTWGDKRTHADIEINGAKVPVRENLWDFLHQQQLHGNQEPFWVDALCIQQSEVYERNHQVQMMGFIYSNARLVLIWLGKESDDSDLAMRALTDWEWHGRSNDPYLLYKKGNENDTLIQGAKSASSWDSKERSSILSLCSRRYWSRMWIIQEVMLASDREIHCGTKILKWDKLFQLYRYTNGKLDTHDEISTPFYLAIFKSPAISVVEGANNRNFKQPHLQVTFSRLLQMYGYHECEDIRDKIYALVGVGRYGSALEVEYRKSAKDVLLDIFYHEGNRMSWDGFWNEDSIYVIGRLLKRVLEVSFPDIEIQLHVDRIRDLTDEKLTNAVRTPLLKDFFKAVIPPQKNT